MDIRIYIEGAGLGAESKAQFRQGFKGFLSKLDEKARPKKIKIEVIPCGGRDSTYSDFRKALRSHPSAFNILLVDAGDAIAYEPPDFAPCDHLNKRDNWEMKNIADEQCHLMVRTMETWLICDIQNLKDFYKQGFHEKSIPKTQNVERIEKTTLNDALKKATQNTTAGEYHKMRHGPKLLKTLDAELVRKAAAHCERFLATIEEKIEAG